ncbi:hypothetical protein LLEC1_04967 [Akanthomyces lecanii]|uniref:Myb-like domain-containing protein n=1 Tax=Cordyceps confragosa TaxID=2714763 RepID=A0A179I9I2_CORDF|nr:hypothetical protein LLEC1_04967 [Akanthomyces lecanii]
MSSSSRWGDSRGLASTLLSLVRPQSSPARDELPASSEAPRSSAKKHKHRKRRDRDRDRQQQDPDDDAMTTASQELPPLRNDQEASEGEADFGALEVFDSNAAASSQAVESASSKKSRRDKKKDNSATKAQKLANRYSSSANGHDEDEPAVTPSSPSKKKRKNSDSSDGKERKKRKSHAAIDSIPEEQIEPAPPSSPSAARAHKRGQSGDGAGPNGAEVDEIERDVEAVAREAWQEHINNQASQLQDTEMTDAAPVALMEPVEIAIEAPEEAPAGDATTTPRRARSTRKKSKPTYFDQPVTDASLDAFGQLPSPSAVTPKPRRAKKAAPKKGARRQRKADREQELYGGEVPRANFVQGKFSDEEMSRIAHAIESFRAEYDMEQRDVNEMIQASGGTQAGQAHAQLWLRIFSECPDRHRQKVINVARKNFHNFVARGTWNEEQDNELASLINIHGSKWSYIAGIINRHPEDIRDRYRNYLVCGGAQKKEAWDDDEEARLTRFVQDAMEAIDELRSNDPSRDLLQKSYEELIDWQNISERMERTRSRLQCITKWKSMNLRIHSKDKLASANPESSISFRLDKARRQLEDMPDTEKYRLVLAINSSAAAVKIPWHKLCDKQFRSSWHRSTQELVWSRLVKSVPGSDMRTVRDCAQYLVDKYDQDGELPNIGGEGWDDDEEMMLIAQVPGKKEPREDMSSEKLTAEDMEGDDEELAAETQEMQIDPALESLAEVPQSAKKATPAKRTQNGKRPSARKSKRPVEPIEESADIAADGGAANAAEIDESSHRKRKTPSKSKKGKVNKAPVDPSSDMDDMEDLPSRVEAE